MNDDELHDSFYSAEVWKLEGVELLAYQLHLEGEEGRDEGE